MSAKMASVISSVITFLLVLLIVVAFGFGGIVLLNGFMDSSAAIYTGFTCLGITLILCSVLAWILAKTFISRFDWNQILSVFISVLVSSLLGGGLGIASMIIMGVVAEVMWRS